MEVVVVVIVCARIFRVRSNSESDYILYIDAETYANVDPSTFLSTGLDKSDGGSVSRVVRCVSYIRVFRVL
jgi:hypothetical protein